MVDQVGVMPESDHDLNSQIDNIIIHPVVNDSFFWSHEAVINAV